MKRTKKINTRHFVNVSLPTLLTVIAVIAIIWYLITSFDVINEWWSFPLLAIVPGILAIVIPPIAKRIKALNSVIATGITVLLMITVLPFVIGENNEYQFGNSFLLILIVSLLIELYSYHKLKLGDLIIDIVLSLLSACLIIQSTYCVTKLIILLITYILTIVINCNFSLSWRSSKKDNNDNNNAE